MTRSLAIPREVLDCRVSDAIPIPDWVRGSALREPKSMPRLPWPGEAALDWPRGRDAIEVFMGSGPVPPHAALELLDVAIRALHVRLRFYAENATQDPESRGKYEAILAQLRALRQQEAHTLLHELDRNLDWRPGEGREAIRAADALIEKYAHLAAADDPSDDPDPAPSST